jgi:hypothetical protein
MSPDVISRKSARAAGRTFYFTGKPCKHGHVAERYSHKANCVICTRRGSMEENCQGPQISE